MSEQSNSALRDRIEVAHSAVREAQDIAYRSTLDGKPMAPLRVRLALNRAQSILIKLLVRYPR